MIFSLRSVMILVLLGIFSSAQAETVYVAEKIRIGMHAEILETSAVVKTVETGTPLEVLERGDRFVHVRDPQGAEGWIEARYLTPEPPARLQLMQLQQDLAKNRKQLADNQAQLKKAQATVADQAAKIKALEQEATDRLALSPKLNPAPMPVAAPPVGTPSRDAGFSFSYLWLGISFAMLGIGFAAGVRWLRESIRKRSGGMYLRV